LARVVNIYLEKII